MHKNNISNNKVIYSERSIIINTSNTTNKRKILPIATLRTLVTLVRFNERITNISNTSNLSNTFPIAISLTLWRLVLQSNIMPIATILTLETLVEKQFFCYLLTSYNNLVILFNKSKHLFVSLLKCYK